MSKKDKKSHRDFWASVIYVIGQDKPNNIFSSEVEPRNSTIDFVKTYFYEDGQLIESISNEFDEMIEEIEEIVDKFNQISKNNDNLTNDEIDKEKDIPWAKVYDINKTNTSYIKNKENPIDNTLEKIDEMTGDERKFLLIKTNIFSFFTSSCTTNYKLPLFQRTYSWDPSIIEGFFTSLFNDYKDNQSFSLLNSIILTSIDNQSQIIDGQQRITSLIIIIFALAKYYQQLKDQQNIDESKQNFKDLLSFPINNILDLVNGFTRIDDNYKFLERLTHKQYINDEDNKKYKKSIENTSFYKNWVKVCLLIQDKIKKIDELYDFTKHIMYKTFFSLSYIREIKEKDIAKIFCNLNKYSKKLGTLDLFRNRLYELFKEDKTKHYIDAYNYTINLYFRRKNKATSNEYEALIQDFLDSILVKYGKFDDISEINRNFSDKITNAYEKFNLLFDEYYKNDKTSALEKLWEDILQFEYFSSGSIKDVDGFIKANKNIEEKCKENKILWNLVDKKNKFSKKIEYFYINFQIYHLSNEGKKSVFIPLIWTIADKLKLFDSSNKKNNEIEQTYSQFSKYLVEIEKFSLLWETEYKAQSLTRSINEICKSKLLDKKGEFIQPNKLYEELEEMIGILKDKPKSEKILKLYELLNSKFNQEITNNGYKNKISNYAYKNVLGRLAYSLTQEETPKYFCKYETDEQKEYYKDFTNYTYDHHTVPQTINKNLADIFNKAGIEDYKRDNLIHKIGNGALITQPDNASKGNKSLNPEKKNHFNQTVNGEKTKFNIIDFSSLKDGRIVAYNDQFIQIPPAIKHFQDFVDDELTGKVDKNFKKYENLNEEEKEKLFKDFTQKIKNRSQTIIESYISALFYDWIEKNE
ncbi:hypothetical protein MBVG596_1051 [Mycoplasmopsis bovigenitalium]|uniref:DUF262 domain-containing protein n=1 Tax=Mycoplasmopsis bovigenitalium TaxID=2112 RepID=UPI00090C6C7A|nr:DUF262 domain-containing protein [Mycoplasmopsis bovigenitalium]BAW18540.1 hypothetical protein MBVG596_1051 [Mycoplasmopsis bovigenitalium]